MGLMRTQAEDQRIRLAKPSVSMPTFNSGSVTGKVEFDPDVMGGSARWSVTLTSNLTVVSSTGGAAKAGGVKLIDFPTGLVLPRKTVINGTFLVSGTGDSTAGEIGLGTVVGTGAVAVLGGTATFENVCEGGIPALGNATAGGAAVAILTGDTVRSEIGTISTAQALYLNAASTFAAGTGAFVVVAGTRIDVWYDLAR